MNIMADKAPTLAEIAKEYAEALQHLEKLNAGTPRIVVHGVEWPVAEIIAKTISQYLPQTVDAVREHLQRRVAELRQALNQAEEQKPRPILKAVTDE